VYRFSGLGRRRRSWDLNGRFIPPVVHRIVCIGQSPAGPDPGGSRIDRAAGRRWVQRRCRRNTLEIQGTSGRHGQGQGLLFRRRALALLDAQRKAQCAEGHNSQANSRDDPVIGQFHPDTLDHGSPEMKTGLPQADRPSITVIRRPGPEIQARPRQAVGFVARALAGLPAAGFRPP
jgi:hypothetical protein